MLGLLSLERLSVLPLILCPVADRLNLRLIERVVLKELVQDFMPYLCYY